MIHCGDGNAVVFIPLRDGTYALVNKRDACLVRMFRWSRDRDGYVRSQLGTAGKRSMTVLMHRLILGVHKHPHPLATSVDHDDDVKWNNTRKNISVVGQSVNTKRRFARYRAKLDLTTGGQGA